MSEQQNQISKLAVAIVEHQRHFGMMSTPDRQWAIQNTEAAIGLFADAVSNRDREGNKKLLKFIRNISFPAVDKFVAADKFRVELGGEGQVETFLAHFWESLKTANRKLWHVRYIRDANDVLWAVGADWRGGGLNVEAVSLDNPSGWVGDCAAGYRFLSR